METGKPGLARAPVHISSVAAQAEKRMDIQAPLTAVYIHSLPALPALPHPQPPTAVREMATLHLAVPPLYSKETLPFLTLHIAGGLQSQPGLSMAAAAAPAAKLKSAGKHVCPHCGRDCMKPSVLEKHLRCHTGERPYPCTTCGVSFKTQSNLYKHRRTQAHARLSSESEQSSLGSLDSSSRETCTSSFSLDERSEESGSIEKDLVLPATESTSPMSITKVCSVKTQSLVSEQNELNLVGHNREPNESEKVAKEDHGMEHEKPPLTISRHLPLQRQEATLFSKQWESSSSRGKSQSHESTDSGFSESSDHYPSPGSVLPDHSMDSLTESNKEHLEATTSTQTPLEMSHGGQEPKDAAKEQEQKTLEERISKLISENTAVVEDKQLENVRPRKTVLSKQGSIDLPMPYTYKDSFHFEMKISQTQNSGMQTNRKPGLYSSVPTQRSSTMDHAPLTRSNSLPFSVTLLQPEKSPTPSHQSDYVTLERRGSSGQINPTGFTIKPVNQHSSTHRPLVRQTAVDCNHAADGLFMNSSVEEACAGSLSCDGDGSDICGEPSNRKFRRKKAQKFAYNKWYMYGGGTFKKLYNAEKGSDNSVIKGRKCLANPEQEVVQGLKRLPIVNKETVTASGSTVNLPNSGPTVSHPDLPTASLPSASPVDFNPQMSAIKTPLQRNLSLSVLPLPSIGSQISHKTDCVNRTEAGRLIHEEKHTDSTSQICGPSIPSNRKKQRTDSKVVCPLEMETNPNPLTYPPSSVTGNMPQQGTNVTYINLNKTPKHTQLEALFPRCIINANAPCVSTSPVVPIPSPANNSFLPKYQLKLPNAVETVPNPSPQVVDEVTGTFTSTLSSSHALQTLPSVTTCAQNCRDPIISPMMQTCDVKKPSPFSAAPDQLVLPCTVTTLCQNLTTSLAVAHKQFSSTTKPTSCQQGHQAGLSSTFTQSLKSAMGSTPEQLSQPVATAVANLSATLTVTTANNQTSAAVTAFSQDLPYVGLNPPLSHTQLSTKSDLSNPGNRRLVAPNTPVVPCHIVPFDQVQPAAQNVFHVHTADLQICLQIISDEQLALIEPQIERPSGTALSQRCDMEGMTPEGIKNKGQSFVTIESSNETKFGHQKEMDKSECLPTINRERITPSPSVQVGKAEPSLHLAECSNPSQPAISAVPSISSETSLLQHPHKYTHVNMVTDTQSATGDLVSTATSLRGVKSGRSQNSKQEQARSLNRCHEEQLLLDGKVSQGGTVSKTLSSQNKLCMSSLTPSIVHQNSINSEPLDKESQHKLKNQVPSRSGLESGECLGLAPGGACTDKLSEYKSPRQLNSQASAYCSNQMEHTLSQISSNHANMRCDRVGSSDNITPSLDVTSHESQDQTGLFTFMSSNNHVEKPKDIPDVHASNQSPTAGLTEGASMTGCAAQKEPQTQEGEGTPGQPDSADHRPKQVQGAGEKTQTCLKEQGGCDGVTGEDKNMGVRTDKLPGQLGKIESACQWTVLPDVTNPEGEDRKVKVDSFANSWLSEQHLLHLSQTRSGMSEYPPQSPQQALSTSVNPNLPASSIQASFFNSPHPPLEVNPSYLSQQSWENSVVHSQQTQVSLEPNSSQHIKAPVKLLETQNVSSRSDSGLELTQTFSHQDPKHTSITQGNTTAGNNSMAVGCCNKLTSGGQKNSSLSPDVGTLFSPLSSQVSPVCRATAGLTRDIQTSKNDQNTGLPSKPFTYPEPDDMHDTMDKTPNDYTTQSIFLAGYQPVECLNSGVRPVQSCQDYTEDTSSSDDEGKLIIEL